MPVERKIVIEVDDDCENVESAIREMLEESPARYLQGVEYTVDRERKRGKEVLVYRASDGKPARVETWFTEDKKTGRIIVGYKGDLEGETVLAFIPRGDRCRVHVSASASKGRLLDLHGAEAVIRILNRVATDITSTMSARILPSRRLREADMIAALHGIINLVVDPAAAPDKYKRFRTLVVNVEEKKRISAMDFDDEEEANMVSNVSVAIYAILEKLGVFKKYGELESFALVLGNGKLVKGHLAAGLATITVFDLEQSKPEEEGAEGGE